MTLNRVTLSEAKGPSVGAWLLRFAQDDEPGAGLATFRPALSTAPSPARAASSDGTAATRAKARASSPVQRRFSSPYVATEVSIIECGLRVPTTWNRPAASRTRVSPVTRACELVISASMSRRDGSKYWPSCRRSP